MAENQADYVYMYPVLRVRTGCPLHRNERLGSTPAPFASNHSGCETTAT